MRWINAGNNMRSQQAAGVIDRAGASMIGPAAEYAERQGHSECHKSGPRRAEIGQEIPQAMKYSMK